MSNSVSKVSSKSPHSIEDVILYGDLSKLTPEQRIQYVGKLCEVTGMNPITKPFEFITLSGKLVCYAGKNCAEQLRNVRQVSLRITAREKIEDVYVVTAEASMKDGRIDSATGAVSVSGLKGEALANAMMKAETKAKRRATLSICSLGMLDETEVESVNASQAPAQAPAPTQVDAKPTEQPKSRPLVQPLITRKEHLFGEIRKAVTALGLAEKNIVAWTQEDFGKTPGQLTDQELERFLQSLQEEVGRCAKGEEYER